MLQIGTYKTAIKARPLKINKTLDSKQVEYKDKSYEEKKAYLKEFLKDNTYTTDSVNRAYYTYRKLKDAGFDESEIKTIFTLDKDAFKSICWKKASFEQNVQSTTFRGDENLPTNIMGLSTLYQFFR